MALSSSQVLTLDKTSLETGKRGNSPTGLFTQKDKPCSFLIMNFTSLSYKTVTRVDHMYHSLFDTILGSFTPHCFSVTYSGDTSLIASWSPLQLNLSQGSVWNIYRSPRAARPLAKKPVAVIPQTLCFLFSRSIFSFLSCFEKDNSSDGTQLTATTSIRRPEGSDLKEVKDLRSCLRVRWGR